MALYGPYISNASIFPSDLLELSCTWVRMMSWTSCVIMTYFLDAQLQFMCDPWLDLPFRFRCQLWRVVFASSAMISINRDSWTWIFSLFLLIFLVHQPYSQYFASLNFISLFCFPTSSLFFPFVIFLHHFKSCPAYPQTLVKGAALLLWQLCFLPMGRVFLLLLRMKHSCQWRK